jgi:hypothetical protein
MKFLVPAHDALHLLSGCESPPGGHDATGGSFAHWRQRAITNLATIFGDDSKAVADFEKISFLPTWDEVSPGPEIEAPRPFTTSEKSDAYRRGEQQVRALIDGLLERVRLAIRLEDQQRQREAEERQRKIEEEEERQRKLEQQRVQPQAQQEEAQKRVFVVHGHDKVLKHTVARVIGALGLELVIL